MTVQESDPRKEAEWFGHPADARLQKLHKAKGWGFEEKKKRIDAVCAASRSPAAKVPKHQACQSYNSKNLFIFIK